MRFKVKTSYATGFNCTFIDQGVNANKSQSLVAAVVLKERFKHLLLMLLAWLSVYLKFLPQLLHHFLVGSPNTHPPTSSVGGLQQQHWVVGEWFCLPSQGLLSALKTGNGSHSGLTFMILVMIKAETKRHNLIRLDYVYLEYYWSRGSVLGSIFITQRANRHSALIKRRHVQTWRSTVSCLAQRCGRHPFGQQLPVKEPNLYLKQRRKLCTVFD